MTVKSQIEKIKKQLKLLDLKINESSGIQKGILLSDKQTLINKIDELKNLPKQPYLNLN